MRTRKLVEREMRVARISARRAGRAAALFSAWLLVTWLGPDASPPAGWTVWHSFGALLAYSFVTVAALVAVWRAATRVLLTGVLRRVVTAYLAPFWVVGIGCGCAGAAVWSAVGDPVVSVWLGIGSALTALTACFAAARWLESRALDRDRRTLDDLPGDVALGTWRRELRARLDAAGSIRLR